MTCRRAREQYTDYLENTLDAASRGRLESHLSACVHCAEELRLFQAMVTSLRADDPVTVTWRLKAAVHAKLEDEARGVTSDQQSPWRRRNWWRIQWAASGAVVLALVGFGLWKTDFKREKAMTAYSVAPQTSFEQTPPMASRVLEEEPGGHGGAARRMKMQPSYVPLSQEGKRSSPPRQGGIWRKSGEGEKPSSEAEATGPKESKTPLTEPGATYERREKSQSLTATDRLAVRADASRPEVPTVPASVSAASASLTADMKEKTNTGAGLSSQPGTAGSGVAAAKTRAKLSIAGETTAQEEKGVLAMRDGGESLNSITLRDSLGAAVPGPQSAPPATSPLRLDFRFVRTDIHQAFRTLGERFHRKVVVAPQVKGIVTLELRAVTFEEAMTQLSAVAKLSVRCEKPTAFVSSP